MKYSNEELGLLRILYFGLLLFLIPFDQIVNFAQKPEWLLCRSQEVYFQFTLSHQYLFAVGVFAKVSLLFVALGLFTTLAYWTSFLSILTMTAYWSQFCFQSYLLTPIPIGILIWTLLDRNSGYRIEDRIFNLKQKFSNTDHYLVSMQKIYFALIFFSAGVSKLLNSGWQWFAPENLRDILVSQNFFFQDKIIFSFFSQINHALTEHPFLCQILGIVVLFCELCAPLAYFSTKAKKLLVPGLAAIQISIGVLMYIRFQVWLVLYLCWLPPGFFKVLINLASKRRSNKQ